MLKTLSAIGAAALLAASPASAQVVVGGGLVNVNISDVIDDIAVDLDVDVADLVDIGSVQVPIGIAANVCGVNANVLAHQRNAGGAECDATSTSNALNRIVQDQMIAQ